MLGRLLSTMQRPLLVFFVVSVVLAVQPTASASPFGQGLFGADVPFGSATSLAISLGGNVSLALTPSGQNFTASSSHTITVTSTDVVGYNLYAYAPGSAAMTNGGSTIPASGNTSAGALAVNSWGYNTDGSSNYLGMTTSPTLLKAANGPFKLGDSTTVSYGVLTNITKAAGAYTVGITYTAVARTQ